MFSARNTRTGSSRTSAPGRGSVKPLSVLLVLALTAAGASGVDSLPKVPPLDPGIILLEGTGAVVCGAACAAGLEFLLTRLADPSEDVWKTFGGTVLSGSLGYPVLCGVGCWASAKLASQQGKLSGAVIGALAATPVGLTVAWVGTMVERLPPGSIKSSPIYVAAALIPPAGAILGYNLTRPADTKARATRLLVPEFRLGSATDRRTRSEPVVDVRAVGIRF
jgi:hypothetical protein